MDGEIFFCATQDPRFQAYKNHSGEAKDYDKVFAKRRGGDLNTTLIFVSSV